MKIAFWILFSFFPFVLMHAQDLSAGLVGYYSFCDCNANDHSGNENHGFLLGNPTCTSGIKGDAFLFNTPTGDNGCGQNGGEYVLLPSLGTIWEDGITICAWVRFDNTAHFERIVDMGNGSGEAGGNPIWFGREGNTSNLTLESWTSNGGSFNRTIGRLVAENAITNGLIKHYCATIEGSAMKIYVNGLLAAQKTGNPILNIPRSSNFIGRSNWCNFDPDFKGFMDEVRIYNRALAPEEIWQLYDAPFILSDSEVTICEGGETQMLARGGIAYEWTPNLFLNSNSIPNPIASPDSTTVYTCEIFFPDGCSITETIVVEVASAVEVLVTEEICEGDNYATYTSSGIYTDVLTSQFGCDSIRTVDLTVLEVPSQILEVSICAGENFDGYTSTGTYVDQVDATVGCDTLRTIQLDVQSLNVQQFSTTGATCGEQDGRIDFDLLENDGSINIFLNDQLIQNESALHQLSAGKYHLRLSKGAACQIDTTLVIPLIDCPVYIPNVFSPNNDGINDVFRIFAKDGFEVRINTFVVYNRWGAEIYKAEHLSTSSAYSRWWDGTFGGEALNNGIFVCLIELEFDNGVKKLISQDIAILR